MSKQALEDMYLDSNMNMHQIAKHFGTSVNDVRVKLEFYRIRKENHKAHGSAIFRELMEESEKNGE